MKTWRHAGFAIFLLVVTLLYWDPMRELVGYSLNRSNTAASQIVLVPFVSATLIWLDRKKVFAAVRTAAVPGALLASLGLAAWVAGRAAGPGLGVDNRMALAAAPVVFVGLGGFLLFYGARAFRQALFPLLFLVFCVPPPTFVLDRAVAFLRWGSAEMAYGILQLTGTPVHRDGWVFTMPNLAIEIAPQCSGIRSGIGMFMTSLLAGHLFLGAWWRRAALVLAAVPLLIFKNAVRIDALSLLTLHVDPGIIEGRLHHEGGIVFFALGLVFLYPVLVFLVRSESASPAPAMPGDPRL